MEYCNKKMGDANSGSPNYFIYRLMKNFVITIDKAFDSVLEGYYY